MHESVKKKKKKKKKKKTHREKMLKNSEKLKSINGLKHNLDCIYNEGGLNWTFVAKLGHPGSQTFK